jgi:Ran-binding protein 3
MLCKQTNGFMAYASTSSPFSSVKGPNLFSRSKSPDTGVLASESTPTKRTGFEAFAHEASPLSKAAHSKSPLFGSSSKWFNTKSSSHRSSMTVDAFSAYASGGAQGFVPLPKRARAGSPSGSSTPLDANSTIGLPDTDGGGEEADCSHTTFGERLRAGRDEEGTSGDDDFQPKVVLKEQEGRCPQVPS